MTKDELFNAYHSWLGGPAPLPGKELPAIPIAGLDVFEDDRQLVNHLFFLVPDTSSQQLRCFFYFEENTFSKDSAGDLVLEDYTLHLFSPQ